MAVSISVRLRWISCVLATGVLLYGAQRTSSAADFDREIVNELQNPTRVEGTDFPLDEMLVYLADYHGIAIVIDRPALKTVNLDPAVPITMKTENDPPLEEVLTELLSPLQLSFMVEGGALKITSATKAKTWQEEYAKRIVLRAIVNCDFLWVLTYR